MQFNIELFPAPFGPIIALISCRKILKEILVIALTPPNRKEIFFTSKIGAPIRNFLSVIFFFTFVIFFLALVTFFLTIFFFFATFFVLITPFFFFF